MPDLRLDSLAPLPRAILELYAGALREVRFPDLDHDSLTAAAAALLDAEQEVERVETALAEARDAARVRAEVLSAHAQRALSYAQVFAAGRPKLGEAVAQIEQLSRGASQPAPSEGRRRGRPKKSKTPELFHDEASDESAASDEAAAEHAPTADEAAA